MDASEQELVRRIASVVGHELRNPMAVINNSAYFVRAKLQQGGIDPKVEKHLKIIESEIARADALIGDILTYSRKAEPSLETQPWDSIVEQAVAGFTPPEGARVELKLGAKGAKAKVDGKLLADSLRRLLDNAMDAQGGKGCAKVATGLAGDGVFVTVTDCGAGLDPKMKDLVFQAFATTKPRGLGLGLALARKLTVAQGGSVSYESTPKGCTFRLSLPKA